MPFEVIKGEGRNPRRKDELPSIIYFDAVQSPEEERRREQEVKEHDRRLRGFRGVISNKPTNKN
ncbi:MAG: hypothetical protein EOP04_04305 [Proteobacteria bacterium]|nr:MAG: hypothetical protein EOP04_04305 [Pseudomonadota bacterium]